MSNLFWYIDIQETEYSDDLSAFAGSQSVVQQYPRLNDDSSPERGLHTFTVGPIILPAAPQMRSIKLMIDKIQEAFDASHDNNDTPQYYIRAKIRPVVGEAPQLGQPANGVSEDDIRASKELLVEYQIYNEEDIRFNILLYSGPYGANSSISLGPEDPPSAKVSVINEMHPTVVEVPYCEISSTITDRPPTSPDVNFVPYVGINNKLLILLNSRAGKKTEKPILLHDDDFEFIKTEYRSQHEIDINTEEDLIQTNLLLEYRNDDPVRKYDIFRVDEKPKSYQNFRGKHLALLDEPVGPDKFSTALSFVDDIEPNRKYWYCARARDVHNNISNPTTIFQVEMVDDRGRMYLVSKPFIFQPDPPHTTKSGHKFIAIKPRLAQILYDPEISPGQVGMNISPDNNILGASTLRKPEGDLIWGKKFKIRVTSKKTGRKIDLNLTFKNEGVSTP